MTGYITQQGVCRQAPLRFLKVLLLLTTMTVVSVAQAARITVDSPDDGLTPTTPGTTCTLRGAVAVINNSAAIAGNDCTATDDAYGTNDTIVFDDSLAGKTVQFTAANGTITISKPLTIQGPPTAATDPANRVTLQGGGTGSDFRLLYVDNNTSPLTVEDLDFTYGNVTGSGFAGGGAIRSNSSAVTVRRCRFEGNHAAGYGGAIETNHAEVTVAASEFLNNSGFLGGAIDTMGRVTVSASTFSGNEAGYGGGAIQAGTATVSASSFSGNEAVQGGGAIYAHIATVSASTFSGNKAGGWGGAIAAVTLTGRHLTLVNNRAPDAAAVFVFVSADLANSLIAGGDANAQCAGDSNATFTSAYNLVANMPGSALTDDTSCGTTSNTNPVSIGAAAAITDIVETTLADHGGPTQTLALPVDSPAVGAADPNGATSQMLEVSAFPAVKWIDAETDQRGSARAAAANGRDLGASEAKVSGAKSATPIPLLGPGALALLAGLLGVIGWRRK